MIRINDGTVRMRYQLKSKMLERIVDRRNMEKALKAVERNGGAAGVDDLQSDELRQFLNTSYQSLCEQILKGTYKPKAVLKVEIPKVQGGVRMLGIPTVTDRMIQQAIHQVLSPVYEEQFDKKSFGFRRGRNAHQAVQAAKENINAGYGWIIELDLEKFFDKVNHQKLMALLSNTVKDKGTLKLIHAYLKSGIMEGGVVSPRTEGTPQGSPLALRTHLQTLIFPGRYRLKEVSFDYIIKSSIFMINGKSTELGISQAYQPGIYFAAKGKTSAADSRAIDAEIWGFSNTGIPLYAVGKRDQRENGGTGKFCGVYRQVATYTDQADKEIIGVQRAIDQQSGPYCAGRIFSKEGSCQKRRNKLRYHLPMIVCGSKSSRRFTISLFRPTSRLFSLNKFLMN